MRLGPARGFLDFRIGRIGAPVTDILADGAIEEVGLLRDIGKLLSQRGLFHRHDVGFIDQDTALVHIVKARQQIDERRFARARRPDKGRHLSGFSHEAHMVEYALAVVIGKADIFECNAARSDGQVAGIRCVGLFRLGIEDLVDHARIDDCAFERNLQARETPGRIVGKQKCGDECDEGTGQFAGIDQPVGGVSNHTGDRESGNRFRQRRCPFAQARDPVGFFLGGAD